MNFLFSLVHRFKTIHQSLTKISTLYLLNKHQLRDKDYLFSYVHRFKTIFFLSRFSPLALLLLYIPLPIVFYIILTQLHIWDSPNLEECKWLVVLMRRSEFIVGFVRVVIGCGPLVVWDFWSWNFCVGFTMMCDWIFANKLKPWRTFYGLWDFWFDRYICHCILFCQSSTLI